MPGTSQAPSGKVYYTPVVLPAAQRSDICAEIQADFEEVLASESDRAVQTVLLSSYECDLERI